MGLFIAYTGVFTPKSWPPLSAHLAERVGHLGGGTGTGNTKKELATCGAVSKFLEVPLCT